MTVASFLNAGFTPKAGVQYHRQKGDLMFFGWLVADLNRNGGLDLFCMLRLTPPVSSKARLFDQMELFPVWKPSLRTWNVTERLRLCAKSGPWAAGWMFDLNQSRKGKVTTTGNMGLFIRHEL